MGYNTVTVTTSATLIVGANTKRHSVIIDNVSTSDVYVGPDSSTTASNGIKIEPSGNITEDSHNQRVYKGDYYGIVSSGTADVRYWEREGNL